MQKALPESVVDSALRYNTPAIAYQNDECDWIGREQQRNGDRTSDFLSVDRRRTEIASYDRGYNLPVAQLMAYVAM